MFGRWKRSREKQRQATEFASVTGRTFIGEQVRFDGFIRCEEDLYINGLVEGTVELSRHRLTVGEKGRLAGEIRVQNATINGRVKGDILSEGKIEISPHGHFEGKIEARTIAVADGAYLKAEIRLTRDPATDGIATNAPLKDGNASGEIDAEVSLNHGNESSRSSQ